MCIVYHTHVKINCSEVRNKEFLRDEQWIAHGLSRELRFHIEL